MQAALLVATLALWTMGMLSEHLGLMVLLVLLAQLAALVAALALVAACTWELAVSACCFSDVLPLLVRSIKTAAIARAMVLYPGLMRQSVGVRGAPSNPSDLRSLVASLFVTDLHQNLNSITRACEASEANARTTARRDRSRSLPMPRWVRSGVSARRSRWYPRRPGTYTCRGAMSKSAQTGSSDQ
eukprot:6179403-Pleurochrysis_carterae.AAC.3